MRISDWSSDVCSADLAQQKIAKVKLPAGYYLEWGGQFESLQAASKRLSIVVPLCFAGIFLLLYRSEEHTSELQSLMRISYAVFCLKKQTSSTYTTTHCQQLNYTLT